MNILRIFSLTLIVCHLEKSDSQESQQWFREKWLGQNYLLKCKTDATKKEAIFRVEVFTKGWVYFGFSKHGLTNEVDSVIGWINETGQSSFNDFWTDRYGDRHLDQSQDWQLLLAEENGTHTTLEFSRKYVTCDLKNDLELFDNEYEESNIVFGYSFSDPESVETIGDPIVEGVFHLNLFVDEKQFEPKEKDIEEHSYWLNVTLPPQNISPSGLRMCKLYKNSFEESIIVKNQAFASIDNQNVNHHTLLMGCPRTVDKVLFEKHLDVIFPCGSPKDNLYIIKSQCPDAMFVTSVLSDEPSLFPDNAGITLDYAVRPYLLVLFHSINTKDEERNVSLELKIWTTRSKTRKYEVGNSMIGTSGFSYDNWGYLVPPQQPIFYVTQLFDIYCYEDRMVENGIYIFSVMFHTHRAIYMELRHYKKEKLKRILRYNHYDYRYQPNRHLIEPIYFTKGDQFVVVCGETTLGIGKTLTNPELHCIMNVNYYPKIKNFLGTAAFSSRINYKSMLKLTGLDQIDEYDNTRDEAVIRRPKKYNNTKLIDFISENKFKMNDPRDLQKLQIEGDKDQGCLFYRKSFATRNSKFKTISPPTGLYESILSRRPQNSCLIGNSSSDTEAIERVFEKSYKWSEITNKVKLSLKLLFNSFKVSFYLQNI